MARLVAQCHGTSTKSFGAVDKGLRHPGAESAIFDYQYFLTWLNSEAIPDSHHSPLE
jgi:hypothetical protein